MKKLLFAVLTSVFMGCGGGDELVVDTEMWFLARTDRTGNNAITGTFCLFKPGDYDPTTFEYIQYSPNIPIWETASLKTRTGETVRSFFIDIVLKGDGYGTHQCDPGEYYVVVLINGSSGKEIWKTSSFTVSKNKWTIIEPIFKNLYTEGYVEWDE